MGDVNIVEGTLQVDDVTLHTKSWFPSGPPKAKLVLIHGFSDHVDRYYDFFPTLARRGIAVYGFDQRGWGRSVRRPADKGRSGPTFTVLADIAAFIRAKVLGSSGEDVPIFMLGHSMGGGEVLTFASTSEYDDIIAKIRGFILEAPFLGFAPSVQPSWLTITSGRLAAHVVPNLHLFRPVPPEHLSRDPEVQKSIANDPLMHNTGTLEGLAGMIDRAEFLSAGKLTLRPRVKSILLAHGTADMVTSFDKVKEWWERQRLEDGTFKAYDGWAHQLHADPGKEEYYQDVADWILARSDRSEEVRRAPEAKL
ncbi:alpha/beta-hydrolase [Annulohypoxylon maeteangense]|uniref:alpha/beta-hydrolase n=1 Tax=Annulohypoxylon maeteangense TaxID=1927788 RepID=UPI0020086DF0|nr:alpha/beta-hydrolase [Annulohypoxylon maeteangense]KAI0881161.1 alpha/beta-hydrolase [Annulohypoxylon maeteangense]